MKTASTFRSPNTSDLQWQSLKFFALYYNNRGILSVIKSIITNSVQLDRYFSCNFLMFLKTLNMVSSAQKPKNYLSFNFFAFSSYQDKQLFTNKRWIHYDVPICSRELKNRNFLVTFVVIFVPITEFVTFGSRIMFFSECFRQPCSIGLSAT